MSSARRVGVAVMGALAFGLFAAWAKGQNTDATSVVSHARAILGNVSTPWLLIAFIAGAQTKRVPRGAVLGLLVTMVALAAFYVFTTLVINLTAHGWLDELRREFTANRYYLEGGLVSGPVFGAIGSWWSKTRTLGKSFVVGALLVGEPLVLAALGMVFPVGVITSSRLPGLIRIVPGWSFSQSTDAWTIAVYSAEFAAGLAVLAVTLVRYRRSLPLQSV